MNQEDFETLLRMWGYAYGPRRHELAMAVSDFGDSPLSRLGRPTTIRQVTTMDRGGVARRQHMGAVAGLMDVRGKRTLLAPAWAVDPVRCTESRTSCAKVLGAGDRHFSPEVVRVERSALSLQRANDELGRVLRAEYCTLGGQADKAGRFHLRRNAYRERLAEARGWVRRDLGT